MNPTSAPRYIMIGGFLGAGKTTTVARLARRLADQGLRVGLITNDQGSELVDTAMLAARGFPVEEISGGCFCCRFNSLLEAAQNFPPPRARTCSSPSRSAVAPISSPPSPIRCAASTADALPSRPSACWSIRSAPRACSAWRRARNFPKKFSTSTASSLKRPTSSSSTRANCSTRPGSTPCVPPSPGSFPAPKY